MAALTTAIAAAGVAASTAGTVMQYNAARRQAAIQKDIMHTQAEGAKIEAARSRRQAYRDNLKATAMNEAAGASGGAIQGSGVAGGIQQAANSGMQTQRDINQNLGMALNINDMQQKSLDTGQYEASLVSGLGSGMQDISKTLVSNQQQIQRAYPGLSWLYR